MRSACPLGTLRPQLLEGEPCPAWYGGVVSLGSVSGSTEVGGSKEVMSGKGALGDPRQVPEYLELQVPLSVKWGQLCILPLSLSWGVRAVLSFSTVCGTHC